MSVMSRRNLIDITQEVEQLIERIEMEKKAEKTIEILLPCPFCGGDAEYFQSRSYCTGHGEYSDSVGVKCSCCGIKYEDSGYANYEVEKRQRSCALKWNRRVGDDK